MIMTTRNTKSISLPCTLCLFFWILSYYFRKLNSFASIFGFHWNLKFELERIFIIWSGRWSWSEHFRYRPQGRMLQTQKRVRFRFRCFSSGGTNVHYSWCDVFSICMLLIDQLNCCSGCWPFDANKYYVFGVCNVDLKSVILLFTNLYTRSRLQARWVTVNPCGRNRHFIRGKNLRC